MKHIRNLIIICVMVIAGMCVIKMNNNAYACNTPGACGNSDEGATDYETRPGCDSSDWHSSVCIGIGWKYYATTSNSVPVVPTGLMDADAGGTIENCGETGGYYRLGLVDYRNTGSGIEIRGQRGIFAVSTANGYGGSLGMFQGPAGGFETWSSTYSKFLIAQSLGVTKTAWRDTGYFCYDVNWETPETPSDVHGEFLAKSTISVGAGGQYYGGGAVETAYDDNANISFSTDDSSVTINFIHKMAYKNLSLTPGANDVVTKPSSAWEVENEKGGSGTYTPGDNPAFKTLAVNAITGPDQVYSDSVTVNMAKGDTKMVCSTITYGKYVKFTETTHAAVEGGDNPDTEAIETDWGAQAAYSEWTPQTPTGQGISRVCAEVYRPDDPNITVLTVTGGRTKTDTMYVGESSNVYYDTYGSHHITRRLVSFKAVVFDYNVSLTRNDSLYVADQRYGADEDPCAHYNKSTYCGVLAGNAKDNVNTTHDWEAVIPVIVSDYVGWKYCGAFGYKYEAWYGVQNGSGSDFSWSKAGYDYWWDSSASCSTIVKKPSVAIWNGSLATNGAKGTTIATSTASRFNKATMGKAVSEDNDGKQIYGTWTEYLSSVGGTLKGLSSGSAFATGSSTLYTPTSKSATSDNSNLTIANSTNLGGSGIEGNSALRTRLETYLRPETSTSSTTSTDLGLGNNITETKQVWVKGNLTINDNIVLSDPAGKYSSIYQLPQVVIFVDGDVNITSNVKQIDAWLIVNGTINTCTAYSKSTSGGNGTQSEAWNGSSVYNSGTSCSNQLVFNGPIIANKLILRRSYGSDNQTRSSGSSPAGNGASTPVLYNKYDAAEIFNYRLDSYLWAYAQSGRYQSSYTEAYTRELAPRY